MCYLEHMLLEGKVEVLNPYTDEELIIEQARLIKNSKYKLDIINTCRDFFFIHPEFWLLVLCDLEEYFDISVELKETIEREFNYEECLSLIKFSKGEEYIKNNIVSLIANNPNILEILISQIIKDYAAKKQDLENLLYHDDMHIRALTICHLITGYPHILALYNEDIIKMMMKFNINGQIEYMNSEDASEIAYRLFYTENISLFNKVKEFIFRSYQTNTLGTKILDYCNVYHHYPTPKSEAELASDANRYFASNPNIRFYLSSNWSSNLNQKILDYFSHYLAIYNKIGQTPVDRIYFNGLGEKLEQYIDKYLSLSTKHKDVHFPNFSGTTCVAIRIGDFILKLINKKYNCAPIICPDLYLIIKSLEEDYIRKDRGVGIAGLEVAPFLERDASGVPSIYLDKFMSTLKDMGYVYLDASNHDNFRLLDSYQDAFTENPEFLPDWFKEYPIVIVDRDAIIKTEEHYYSRH